MFTQIYSIIFHLVLYRKHNKIILQPVMFINQFLIVMFPLTQKQQNLIASSNF